MKLLKLAVFISLPLIWEGCIFRLSEPLKDVSSEYSEVVKKECILTRKCYLYKVPKNINFCIYCNIVVDNNKVPYGSDDPNSKHIIDLPKGTLIYVSKIYSYYYGMGNYSVAAIATTNLKNGELLRFEIPRRGEFPFKVQEIK